MSARIDKSWTVIASHQTEGGDRCVDIFRRQDGTYGFEEFRKDPEDMGAWTPTSYYSVKAFDTAETALGGANDRVGWLGDVLGK